MRCCQSNTAVVEGPHHRRRRKSALAPSGDDDEISHVIEVIDISPMNKSFAKMVQDNEDNRDNQVKPAIDGDEMSELTFGTLRKESFHSSTRYNLNPDESANTPKKKYDRHENKEATNKSEQIQFDLPQSMLRVREEDECSA